MVSACLLVAAPAQAVTFPAGKSTFDSGTQGWTVTERACFPGFGAGLACGARGEHSETVGNPGGSIAARISITVNAGGGFFGAVAWESPAFTVSAAPLSTPTLSLDWLVDPGGLINENPVSLVRVRLRDLTDPSLVMVFEELANPSVENNKWLSRSVPVNPALLEPGHRYQLRVEGAMSTNFLGVGIVGASFLRFDNVGLDVDLPPCCDVDVTPGVQIVRGPVSDAYINATVKGLRWFANKGSGRDGSAVPLERCTILGTSGDDVITGTNGNDVICGLGGNDRINGRGGRDVIDGANGNDRLKGAGGRDVILGLRGRDREAGGAANDKLGGGARRDVISGGSGRDKLHGGSGPDRLRGQSGSDRLNGSTGRDRLFGGSGRDRLFGGSGRDRLFARRGGRDRLSGGRGGGDRATADETDRVRGVEVVN